MGGFVLGDAQKHRIAEDSTVLHKFISLYLIGCLQVWFKVERIKSFERGPDLFHIAFDVNEMFQEREVPVAEKEYLKCLALAKRL